MIRILFMKSSMMDSVRWLTSATAHVDSSGRKNNQYKSFGTLCESLAQLKTPAILDGEIVCLDAEGKSQFMPLMRRKQQASYYCFDLLWLGEKDLRGLPLIKRKRQLQKLLAKAKLPGVIYANHI